MAQKRIDFISFNEFKKLYRSEKDKDMKLLILLGFGAGLRISEIIGLQKEISPCCQSDISSKKVIDGTRKLKRWFCLSCEKIVDIRCVRRKKGEWKISPLTADKIDLKKHQIKVDEAKGGKWRITIAPPLLKESHLQLLPLEINRRTAQNRFKRLCKKVLDKNMSIHILRHGFGNYQMNVLKLPPTMVQQLMGHSRLDTTGIYAKANPEQTISESWNAMMGGV